MGENAREPRQATCASARLNSGGGWQDVCIRNVSSRGMMVEAHNPPPRGHYLEVRRGPHVIVGRVVWSSGYQVGILSQDELEVGAIVADTKAPPRRASSSGVITERRTKSRPGEQRERNRLLGKTMEYGSVLALGAIGAFMVMDLASDALGSPLQQAQAALRGTKSTAAAP